MYLPSHFAEDDAATLHALMQRHPLATWIVPAPGDLQIHHLPMLLDRAQGPHGTLYAHVARANPVWRTLAPGLETAAVFQGEHGYVSPSWYPSKADHGRVVPTWNYAVVHAHGEARPIEDKARLRALVARLTEMHEAPRDTPWHVDDAPEDYLDRMLDAIVGIEIPIQRLQGKFKLSQNRAAADRAGVAAGLAAEPEAGSRALAVRMRSPRAG